MKGGVEFPGRVGQSVRHVIIWPNAGGLWRSAWT